MQALQQTCRFLRCRYTAMFSSKFKEALLCRVSLEWQRNNTHFNGAQPNNRTDNTSKQQHVICPDLLSLSVVCFDFIVIR